PPGRGVSAAVRRLLLEGQPLARGLRRLRHRGLRGPKRDRGGATRAVIREGAGAAVDAGVAPALGRLWLPTTADAPPRVGTGSAFPPPPVRTHATRSGCRDTGAGRRRRGRRRNGGGPLPARARTVPVERCADRASIRAAGE